MKKQIIILIIIGILILIGIFYVRSTGKAVSSTEQNNFAQCLTEKGLKMYGTDWCSYCKKQKALFKDSFKHINYIDCDKNREICLNENIRGYPTWKINGQSYSGIQPLKRLSQLTGCEGEL